MITKPYRSNQTEVDTFPKLEYNRDINQERNKLMTLTTLKSAVRSAQARDNSLFSIDELYADFYGANSPSAKTYYKAEKWESLVTQTGILVNAKDLIFIACQLTHRSRNAEFKSYIKPILADENDPRFDLFDSEGLNGKSARMQNVLAQKVEDLAVVQTNLYEYMDKTDELTAKTDKLGAELTETRTELTETKTELTETKTELTETKTELTETKTELTNNVVKTEKLKTELTNNVVKTEKLETELAGIADRFDRLEEALFSTIDKLPEFVHNATYPVLTMFNEPIKATVSAALQAAAKTVQTYAKQNIAKFIKSTKS